MSKEIEQKIRAGYGDMRKSEQKAGIRAGVLVQSGFHRTERKTVPLYDLPQHGSAGN